MKTEEAFVFQLLNTVTAGPFAALCVVLLPSCGAFWQTLARGSVLAASYVKSLCLTLYVPVVVLCTAGCDVQRLCVRPMLYLRVCMANSSFGTVEEIIHLGTILTNRNSV